MFFGIGSSVSNHPTFVRNSDGSTATYAGGVRRSNIRADVNGNWTWDGKDDEVPLTSSSPVPEGAPHAPSMSTGPLTKRDKGRSGAAASAPRAHKDRERERDRDMQHISQMHVYDDRTKTLVSTSTSGSASSAASAAAAAPASTSTTTRYPSGRLPDQHFSGSDNVVVKMRF